MCWIRIRIRSASIWNFYLDMDPELGKFKAGSGSGSRIYHSGSTTLNYQQPWRIFFLERLHFVDTIGITKTIVPAGSRVFLCGGYNGDPVPTFENEWLDIHVRGYINNSGYTSACSVLGQSQFPPSLNCYRTFVKKVNRIIHWLSRDHWQAGIIGKIL